MRPGNPLATWRQYRHLLPLLLAAAVGFGLTMLAWQATLARESRLPEVELSSRARSHALILQNGVDEYISRIVAVRAFFEASVDVDRSEFKLFTDQLLRDHTAILRVTWLPRVTQAARPAHEARGKAEGLPDYQIHDFASRTTSPVREEHFPVFYSTGIEPSSGLYGLDVGSEPNRRATLQRAADTGGTTTSPRITLETATGNRNGFFVLLPVYRRGDTLVEPPNAKPQDLLGFVNAVFQIDVMIKTILEKAAAPAGLDLYLFQGSAPGEELLYFHSARARDAPQMPLDEATLRAAPHWRSDLRVGDRNWSLVAAPVSENALVDYTRAQIVLISGLFLTGLLLAHMWGSARHARRLEVANDDLTKARADLEVQNTRFQAALSNMSQGLVLFDSDRRVVICNKRYMEIYGLTPDQVKPGTPVRDLIEHRLSLGLKTGSPTGEYVRQRIEGPVVPANAFHEFADGRTIAYAIRPMPDGGVATHEDVTEQRRTEARIRHMAHHDALTDLPNRTLLRQRLEEALETGESVVALWLDLDRFKEVNDTLGHAIGDGLLKAVATRLKSCVRDGDTVARLGGDEFAVIQAGAEQPLDATSLASRIIETLSSPYRVGDHQIIIGASVGIAVSPDDGLNAIDLLRSADLALYRAKSDGRGTYRFFEPGMDARMHARRTLELDLRSALAEGAFELHYQPIVNIDSRKVTGLEALLRWNHPQRGWVPPSEFVALAEATGLICAIGQWVLFKACREATKWPKHLRVAVNLSPLQFKQEGLTDLVSEALSSAGLSATRLELEITESVLLENTEQTLAALRRLRALGVRIAMDDFGTGYSSLSNLRSFAFDNIKVDQSFIQGLGVHDQCAAIVQAIANLGVVLEATTTAEGVETAEQRAWVRAFGIVDVQGFFLSPPVPAAEVRETIFRLEHSQNAA
jgi:diguanylate cyclase (GGDEF)-like protein